MRRVVPLVLVLLVALPSGFADEEGEGPAPVTAEQRDAAIRKAFAFLDDHLWRLAEGGSSAKTYAASVAGWAYLLAGERSGKRLPSRARELKRIADYLDQYLKRVERVYDRAPDEPERPRPNTPVTPPGTFPGMLETRQFAWSLGMAGLFLSESHARKRDRRRTKRMLARIVAVLEKAQQPNGGWGHDDAELPGFGIPSIPLPGPGGGARELNYPHTLVAATSCAASALGAAHRILGTDEPASVAKAIEYYRQAQNANGTFPYDPSQKRPARLPAGVSSIFALETARAGGALFALHCLGAGASEEVVERAAAAIDAALDDVSEGHGSATMALQFGALASRIRGEETWRAFREIYFPRILAAQDEEGAFACVCRNSSPGVTCDSDPPGGLGSFPSFTQGMKVYVTSIHTLILLLDRAPVKAVPPLDVPSGPVTPR